MRKEFEIILILGLALIVSCTNDTDNFLPNGATVELVPCVATFNEVDADAETRAATPSWVPSGYDLYENLTSTSSQLAPNTKAAIGTFFTRDGEAPLPRRFSVDNSGHWYIDTKIDYADTYYLYGLVPSDAGTASLTDRDGGNASYSTGAKLTLTGLNSVMNKDVCVIVGAKHGSDASTVSGTLAPGDFATYIGGSSNYIFLLFDHLYAALRFKFRVSNDAPYNYASLRKIKLTRLELMAFRDEACTEKMKSKQSTTITLQANDAGTNPIVGEVTFTPDLASEDMEWVPIFDSEVWLPSAEGLYTESIGFVPKTSSYYLLRSTYDVYDSSENLIRKGCTSENKIDPRRLFNQATLDRGKIYTLRLTVKPTYLYVLSDPDLNNPSLTIN